MPKSQAIDQEMTQRPGFLLIDKPARMTSHDVVDRVRRLLQPPTSNFQLPKVGHAGTLDPFATGLLIVGVGREATREMPKLVGLDKMYEAVFVLGASSTTDDVEGEITSAPIRNHHQPLLSAKGGSGSAGKKEGGLQEVVKQFIGEIEQVPPMYSAIKIGGKKMYEAAREGKPIQGKARRVTIYSIELLPSSLRGSEATEAIFQRIASSVDDRLPPRNDEYRVDLKIHCSSGTYIRSLARDLGRALGGGGYVEQLRRTSIGPFSVQDATTLSTLPTLPTLPLFPVPQFLEKL